MVIKCDACNSNIDIGDEVFIPVAGPVCPACGHWQYPPQERIVPLDVNPVDYNPNECITQEAFDAIVKGDIPERLTR